MRRSFVRALVLLAAVSAVAVAALTAGNNVPASRAGRHTAVIDANALKPAACAALNLTGITVGSGTFNGGAGPSLLLGSPVTDNIRGQNNNDCILGGGANDTLRGNGGTDVCIGGPGADTFHGSCETQVQ